MQYTIENYKKGQLPNINDIVKIGEFIFEVAHSEKGYWLSGIGCENDAFTKYLGGENKYRFAERVTSLHGGAPDCDSGTCPYINTLNGLAEFIKALWDKVDAKENKSDLLMEDDIVNIGPFEYTICKTCEGFFLGLNNRDEMGEKYGRPMSNDGIFEVLKQNKNAFFASATDIYGGFEGVAEMSGVCPYAKTIEGINEVIRRLQALYNDFVNRKKKKPIAISPDEIQDDFAGRSSKNINITIPKKNNPVKLKIVL